MQTHRLGLRRFSSALTAVLLICLACILTGCARWKNLTAEQMLEDFEYLFTVLRDNHPYLALKARAEGYDWLAHKDEFGKAVGESTDDRSFAQAIASMLRQINNGHTDIVPASFVKDVAGWNEEPWKAIAKDTSASHIDYWCNLAQPPAATAASERQSPFLAVYNAGEYVIVAAAPSKDIQDLLEPGMVVLEVNGRPAQDYVKSQRGLPVPWQSRLRFDPARRVVYQRELALPSSGEPITLTVRFHGETFSLKVPWATTPWNRACPWPPTYSGGKGSGSPNLYMDTLGDGKVAYVQIRSFLPRPEDPQILAGFFESAKDLPAIIIDIRGNSGGNTTYWMNDIVGRLTPEPVECTYYLACRPGDYIRPFVQAKAQAVSLSQLTKGELLDRAGERLRPNIPPEVLTYDFADPFALRMVVNSRDSIRYRGRVFVLADDLSFSGAEGFAAFCKATGFATVVGTWTGGDGSAITPVFVSLPNSGMVVRFPVVMGLNPDFAANAETHTRPDVLVEQSVGDIVAYLAKLDMREGLTPGPSWDAALRECLRLVLDGVSR